MEGVEEISAKLSIKEDKDAMDEVHSLFIYCVYPQFESATTQCTQSNCFNGLIMLLWLKKTSFSSLCNPVTADHLIQDKHI